MCLHGMDISPILNTYYVLAWYGYLPNIKLLHLHKSLLFWCIAMAYNVCLNKVLHLMLFLTQPWEVCLENLREHLAA